MGWVGVRLKKEKEGAGEGGRPPPCMLGRRPQTPPSIAAAAHEGLTVVNARSGGATAGEAARSGEQRLAAAAVTRPWKVMRDGATARPRKETTVVVVFGQVSRFDGGTEQRRGAASRGLRRHGRAL
ncbi:hypothetical protein SESBI_39410 [Sesbania bispinosa]|nr:hypothetical protein SESBI_39410 [Sesbania bispinosa]